MYREDSQIQFKYYSSFQEKQLLFNSFRVIFNKSFNQWYSNNTFNWKYLSEFSDNSVIQEIIINKKIIGYRGLWKVNEYTNSYQCIDTCIDPEYQGKGIFKKSNYDLVKTLGSFYNYPNPKSYPGYIKSGWHTYAPMNIYINKLANFEHCKWSADFLNWRFSLHPYITYYKVKIKNGFGIIRFKKNLPVHIESTQHDINLELVRSPIISFKYDTKTNGLKLRNAGNVVVNNFNGQIRSSFFDMI